jgi:hypothetical protein
MYSINNLIKLNVKPGEIAIKCCKSNGPIFANEPGYGLWIYNNSNQN